MRIERDEFGNAVSIPAELISKVEAFLAGVHTWSSAEAIVFGVSWGLTTEDVADVCNHLFNEGQVAVQEAGGERMYARGSDQVREWMVGGSKPVFTDPPYGEGSR